jgi:dihydroxynaphthoic acid synthetase
MTGAPQAYEDILYKVDRNVAFITINRPEVLNALRFETVSELVDAFSSADDDPDVGVIVLTGTGGRAFCVGGDIRYENELTAKSGRRFARELMKLSEAIRQTGKPVVARIEGWCVGGGNELNLLCDLSIASESSKFGHSGPKMGSIPIWYGTQLMPRLVGEKRAKEVVFLCRHYSARQVEGMGWINAAVPDDELDVTVREWCDRMLEMSPQSLRIAKLSINYETDAMLPSVKHGFEILNQVHGTEEFHEGTQAFLDKRQPAFAKYR